jgi:hypothetical protein
VTIIEQPSVETLDTAGVGWTPAVPGTITHPAGEAALPYWLGRSCPPWCRRGHRDDDDGIDRLHSSSRDPEIELTLEPRAEIRGETFPAHIGAAMVMHYRDARPHVYLIVNDHEEVLLELPEAQELARLLADPPNEWASLTLTMMDPDSVIPSGFREEDVPVPERVAHVAAFPFTRSPVAAVRQVLDIVTVFCPVQTDPHRDQSLRYLTLRPEEATELATTIAKLLDSAQASTALGPAEAAKTLLAGPCPPWCEIDDHDDFDGGEMRHSTWTSVDLSSYPYEVTSTESGRPVVTQHCDSVIVSRVQLRNREPAIVLTSPDIQPDTGHRTDPDDHLGLPDGQILLTITEAQDAALALLVMGSHADRSLHFACAPGEPSPCCTREALRQSAYESAVFCTRCGSLYWSKQ